MRAAIALLADGRHHNKTDLKSILAIDEAELDRLLEDLEALGVQRDSDGRTGFSAPLDLLSEKRIRARLSASASGDFSAIELLLTTGSTNDEAMAYCRTHPSDTGRVWLAEQQTAGRGRLGREWYSPFARNIYLTTVVNMPASSAMQGLSLAIGVAVARAFAALNLPAPKLKWPNDILYEHKKLGGILIELPDAARAVIGVGINVRMSPQASRHISQDWTDLAQVCTQPPARNTLVAEFLNALSQVLKEFRQAGLESSLCAEWQALDAMRGLEVTVKTASGRIEGVARGIDSRGALKLDRFQGERSFDSTEVSLRPTNPF